MNQKMSVLNYMLISLSLAFFCSKLTHAEPANLGRLKKEIIEYHDSGLYQQELSNQIKKSHQYIIQRTLLNQKNKSRQKLALILDIDETSLSNYTTIVNHDFIATREQIHKDILAANAPAIEATRALYQDALKRGIKVFFVTGRQESERNATVSNLIKAGYNHWSGLYLRPNKYSLPTIKTFKTNVRAKISKQGYTIIASIGDQYSDICCGYTEKGFKLPNPFYYLP